MLAALLLSAVLPQEDLAAVAEGRRVAMVAECHIPAERLALEKLDPIPPDNMIAYIVIVKGHAPLSDAQIRCYTRQLTDSVWPSFENSELGERYTELARADTLANARKALAELGLLHRLPVHDPSRETLAAFAVRLERLCRARPRSLLVAVDGNIQLVEGWFKRHAPGDFERITCAMNAVPAAGFEVYGAVPLPPLH